jgi:hypothetical protein
MSSADARDGRGRALVELELEIGADPIEGVIRDPAGSESSFRGWLDLIAALERASAAESHSPQEER